MELDYLLSSIYQDTLASTVAFRPELTLCVTIVIMLLLRIVGPTARIHSFLITLAGSLVALWFAAPWQQLDVLLDPADATIRSSAEYYLAGPQQGRPPDGTLRENTRVTVLSGTGSYHRVRTAEGLEAFVAAAAVQSPEPRQLFTGMLVYDNFAIYIRVVLLLFLVLFAIFTRISGIPDEVASPDFYTLVLGATLGMCLMATANHLLIVFLGVEMASVPSYALAGALKGRRQSSEAALKYAVYGAGAAGVMLYGISLLAGVLGSVHIPTMAVRLAALLESAGPGAVDKYMVLTLGALMVMVGVSFKLAAVPFHFWCPDVFHGASAEVGAFLSVASKAAALALLVRLALGFTHVPVDAQQVAIVGGNEARAAAAQEQPPAKAGVRHRLVAQRTPSTSSDEAAATPAPRRGDALAPVRQLVGNFLALVSIVTCTFGNLAAYGQTNIKRLLAYSTIAHAGYMIMPVAAAVIMAGDRPHTAEEAIGALAFYLGVYLFMNLGAFAVVAFLRNELRSEEIADYAGLVYRAPIVVVCFTFLLFSLIGLPPLAGFVGKFLIFSYLVEAKLWTLLVIAGLNTALSLFYYLRVVKVMTLDPEPDNRVPMSVSFIPGTYVVAVTLPVLVLFVWWNDLHRLAMAAARHLLV